MSWHWLLFVVFTGFTVVVSVVPGILMVSRGRAWSVHRYVSIGWRWILVDLTPDETRTVGRLRIAQGALWPCVLWVTLFWDDEAVPIASIWLVAAAALAIFGCGLVLSSRVQGLPSVVEARRTATG